jgi:hypothetical protein
VTHLWLDQKNRCAGWTRRIGVRLSRLLVGQKALFNFARRFEDLGKIRKDGSHRALELKLRLVLISDTLVPLDGLLQLFGDIVTAEIWNQFDEVSVEPGCHKTATPVVL